MNSESPDARDPLKADLLHNGADAPSAARPDIVFVLGADGAIERVDEGTRGGQGFGASALLSTSLFRHIHQTDLMPVFRGVEELVSGREEEVQIGFHLRTAAGIWRSVRGTMRRCSDGRATASLMLTLHLLSTVG